ncbi:MAG: transcriptional repressor [Nitrospirae bacterium]|nr:MAG: transcriptional repressor [Nitrospirota bacterium]
MVFEKENKIFSDYLTKHNLRMTNQRRIILDVFLRSRMHLSPEELYLMVKKKNPSIGQATVYRTLKLLSECGLADEVDLGDGVVRYEHSQADDHHDHLICQVCKKNLEVYDKKIEKQQEILARQHGFTLTGHRMYLYGICPDCKKRQRT